MVITHVKLVMDGEEELECDQDNQCENLHCIQCCSHEETENGVCSYCGTDLEE